MRELTHKIPGLYQHYKGTTYIAMTVAYPGTVDLNEDLVIAQYSEDSNVHIIFQLDDHGVWHYEFIDCTNEDLGLDKYACMVMYGSAGGHPQLWAREYTNFVGEVDKSKYPEITQQYRFEYVGDKFI